ncbi:MAG TPA: hypothetical protein VKE41_06515, partial [Roseiflexaceae bacterium]|nr:hypothetical protein [Roseiflexaceae bacterium]
VPPGRMNVVLSMDGLSDAGVQKNERFLGTPARAASALQTITGVVITCTTQSVEKIFVALNGSDDAFCGIAQGAAKKEP